MIAKQLRRIQKPESALFTKEEFERMQSEFDRLTKLRVEVVVRLKDAREQGDLSENGAYKYAKFELGNIGRQLRSLTHHLRYGKIIEKNNNGQVGFGNAVTLRSSEKVQQFTIVSQHESNPSKGKISDISPIGQAIFGKRVGDSVTITAPAGTTTYTITEIK